MRSEKIADLIRNRTIIEMFHDQRVVDLSFLNFDDKTGDPAATPELAIIAAAMLERNLHEEPEPGHRHNVIASRFAMLRTDCAKVDEDLITLRRVIVAVEDPSRPWPIGEEHMSDPVPSSSFVWLPHWEGDKTYSVVDLTRGDNRGWDAATPRLAKLVGGHEQGREDGEYDRLEGCQTGPGIPSRFAMEETHWGLVNGARIKLRSLIVAIEDPANPWPTYPWRFYH